MTSITRHLPAPIRTMGVAIIGEGCYVSLVEDLNITDAKCLKYALSKGLGLGIVVGGSIMKVPQLLLIVNAKSARGLSLTAYILETLSYAITLTYSFRNEFPFSTYGENLFLTFQNTIITLLIVYYTRRSSTDTSTRLAATAVGLLASGVGLFTVPAGPLAMLQLATIPLSLFSKLPQIMQNHRSQSTGQLSAFAVISQIAGCLARLFTTATEVGDVLLTSAFGLALLLNCVLGAQLWMYWGQEEGVDTRDHVELYANEKSFVANTSSITTAHASTPITSSWDAPIHRTATPPPQTGRKWARKVD